ncbi:hypothetical protein QJS10_CPB19g00998 [Acorus calamus]|uniref:Leucine-rich repeat-containing N-terminal plant-type domain-containing protein n=1 Tax=Acorus calamus TaxID=4465 RepID=A0AAV9CFP6_ACOCL|nr:hypothetical protein QJS10_CPB19g00998 [Acorus calamus]
METKNLSSTTTIIITISIALLISSSSSTTSCHKDDKKALLRIRDSLGGINGLPSWDSKTSCCGWAGVKCDSLVAPGRVNQLYVYWESVNGSISPSVGDLPYLTSLSFHKLPGLFGGIP